MEERADSEMKALNRVGYLDLAQEIKDHITTYCDKDSLLNLDQTSSYTVVSNETWRRLFQRTKHGCKPCKYPGEVQSYKFLYFLVKKVQNFSSSISSSITKNDIEEFKNRGNINNLINKTYASSMAAYLKGLLAEASGKLDIAWHYYLAADREGSLMAAKKVNAAIFWGTFRQNNRSFENRFNELQTRYKRGDENAEKWIALALFSGNLGQNYLSQEERFKELQKLDKNGKSKAAKWVKEIIFWEYLRKNTQSQREARREIIKHYKDSDPITLKWKNRAILCYNNGGNRPPKQNLKRILQDNVTNNKLAASLVISSGPYLKTYLKFGNYVLGDIEEICSK